MDDTKLIQLNETSLGARLEALAPAAQNCTSDDYFNATNSESLSAAHLRAGDKVLLLYGLHVRDLYSVDFAGSQAELRVFVQFAWVPSAAERAALVAAHGAVEPVPVDLHALVETLPPLSLLRWNNGTGEVGLQLGLLWGLPRHLAGGGGDPHLNLDCTFVGTFRQGYRLHNFPFDAQRIVVELELFTEPGWHVAIAGRGVKFDGSALLDEWRVHGAHCALTKRKRFAKILKISMPIQRRARYYTLNFFLPTGLISILSACAGLIPGTDFADRSSLVVTILLTVVFFKIGMGQMLPVKSYTTALDDFGNKSMMYIMIVLLENAAVCFATWRVEEGSSRRAVLDDVDSVMLGALTVLYLTYHCWCVSNVRAYSHVLAQALSSTGQHPQGWDTRSPKVRLM